MDDALIALAREIAHRAHAGQLDRAGLPVLGHVERVAAAVASHGPEAVAVALLHDAIEDAHVTADDLRVAGLPEIVVSGIVALTRHAEGHESYREFVIRAAAHPLGRIVKRADLQDNLSRVPPSDPEDRKQYEGLKRSRYPKALKYLDSLEGKG